MPDIGFVNGRFMPLEEASVPVEDRGYQFADGVYEVVRTYRGKPFRLEAHLARLEGSARAIHLGLPYDAAQWSGYIMEAIRRSAYPEVKVYVQVTRGVAPRDHHVPEGVPPSVVMTVREMTDLPAQYRSDGVAVVTAEDLRWGRCDIKSINLLPNVLARREARARGAFEAIFVRDGEVSEGAVANVMMVSAGELITPPEGPRILSGVTRAAVLEVARKEGLVVRERPIGLAELRAADEVFLTGTTVEVLPVVRVDGARIGAGKPGTVTQRLSARFRALVG